VRWQQFLSEFNLQVAYVLGTANVFADGLSHRPDLRLMFVGATALYDPWLSGIQDSCVLDPVAYKLLKSATSAKQQTTCTRVQLDCTSRIHYW
jgi:hypothetical protein